MSAKISLSLLFVSALVQGVASQTCFSSSTSPACLNYLNIPSCPCRGTCDPGQQISQDVNTLKALVSKVEQKDTSSCLYFNDTSLRYPSQCCSFPFTLDGVLQFRCVPGPTATPGCFLLNRVWVPCRDPGYTASFRVANFTVPTFPDPVPAETIHGWIVFQQRLNSDETFDRPWADFKSGFGTPGGNFWLGLEKVHRLCNVGNCRLTIEAYSISGEWVSEEYSLFFLGAEYEGYSIHYAGVSGDGERFFSARSNPNGVMNGMRFTTWDADHDTRPMENCANVWGGGWWYNNCGWYNFNGRYRSMGFSAANGMKILLKSRMMLRVA